MEALLTKPSPIDVVIKEAGMQSEPRFGTITEVAIQQRANGPWYTVRVNLLEFLTVLQSGEFDNKPLTAVQVCEVTADNEDRVAFIYDFMNLHTDKNPWRIL